MKTGTAARATPDPAGARPRDQALLAAGYALERAWAPVSRVALEFPAPEIRLYRRVRP